MSKSLKIFEDNKIIYERNLSVNTAILKGRLSNDPKSFGNSVHFTLEISNGKSKDTDKWRASTYADCTAFGELGNKILKLYHGRDEIFVIGRFYSNKKDEKIYKGFTVRDVINIKNDDLEELKNTDEDLPF